ncbi:MAG: hypothetical protein KDH15_22215 [Rhodocyclaceae bacterium]|nr:hypothetical protein [Rhodocyclaceae bacterium]
MARSSNSVGSMWRHRDVALILSGGLGCLGVLAALAMIVAGWWGARGVSAWSWWLGAAGLALVLASHRQMDSRARHHQAIRNRRACAIRDEVLAGRNPSRPYFVYLRPFAVDGAFVDAPRGDADARYVEEYGWPTAHHDLESALALLVYRHSDLVALSDEPGRAGAGYVPSTELTWQQEIAALAEFAEGIFMVPFDFAGTAWEVAMIVDRGWLAKTFLVMPARPPIAAGRIGRDFAGLWERGRVRYAELGLPPYDDEGCILHVGDEVTVYRGFGGHGGLGDSRARRRSLDQLGARLAELAAANATRKGEGRWHE